MATRDYSLSDDDSALESDISSSLVDDTDEDNRAVEDLMIAQEHYIINRPVTQPVEQRQKPLPKSSRCRTRRVPTVGRNVALPVDVTTTRRQRKPSAKFMAAAASNNRKCTSLGEVINRTKASRKLPPVSSLMTSSPASCIDGTMTSAKKDRLLMRQWLILMAETRQIPNMYWYNEEHTQIRIPWKHGSRACWTLEDCQLYKAWARHTGKYSESHGDEPKRWKANFRCALNSLSDVVEVKNAGQSRGGNPFKVYQLLEEVNRKNTAKSRTKKTRRLKVDHCEKQQFPQAAVSNTCVAERSQTKSKVQKSETTSDVRQVSVVQRSPAAGYVYQIPPRLEAVPHNSGQSRPRVLESHLLFDRQMSTGVIPVMVEEMSLDEAREAIDDSTNNKEGMLDSSELDKEFLSDYQRSMSTSPSESSGYDTDANLINDVDVMTADDWNAGLSDPIYMPEAPDQFQSFDIITWVAS